MKIRHIQRCLIVFAILTAVINNTFVSYSASGNSGSSSSSKAAESGPSRISKSKAKRIALKDAGLSSGEVEALRARRRERGKLTEVSFYKGIADGSYTNYLYYIKSASGKLKSKSANNVNVITKNAALHIGMAEAAIPQENYLSGIDIALDDSSGTLRYHVTFHGPSFVKYDDQVYSAKKFRYDFIIDAVSGAILTWDAFDG